MFEQVAKLEDLVSKTTEIGNLLSILAEGIFNEACPDENDQFKAWCVYQNLDKYSTILNASIRYVRDLEHEIHDVSSKLYEFNRAVKAVGL